MNTFTKYSTTTAAIVLVALAVVFSPNIVSAQTKPATTQSTASTDESFAVEHYYKAKWGYTAEFIELFKKNHYPVLKKLKEKGDILQIVAVKPRHHNSEESRWDYKVTIVFKNAATAFDYTTGEGIKKELFADQATFKKEEQRRFEILIAHWDVPVQTDPFDK